MKFILNSFIKSYCSNDIFIILNRTFSKYNSNFLLSNCKILFNNLSNNLSKKNLFFLLKVGFGIILGIIIFSKVITYFFKYYYFLTMFFFIGLIGGGIIPIIKKNKSKNFAFIFKVRKGLEPLSLFQVF